MTPRRPVRRTSCRRRRCAAQARLVERGHWPARVAGRGRKPPSSAGLARTGRSRLKAVAISLAAQFPEADATDNRTSDVSAPAQRGRSRSAGPRRRRDTTRGRGICPPGRPAGRRSASLGSTRQAAERARTRSGSPRTVAGIYRADRSCGPQANAPCGCGQSQHGIVRSPQSRVGSEEAARLAAIRRDRRPPSTICHQANTGSPIVRSRARLSNERASAISGLKPKAPPNRT